MKAMIISQQGQQEEAFVLAKEALKNDMKSHICWHVYGLLYRAEKNYEEAIKAYRFALRIEPDSPAIQRDLALLQMQMRDYQGYIQSRTAMLQAGYLTELEFDRDIESMENPQFMMPSPILWTATGRKGNCETCDDLSS